MAADVGDPFVEEFLIGVRVIGQDLKEIGPDHQYVGCGNRSPAGGTGGYDRRSAVKQIFLEQVLAQQDKFDGFEATLTASLLKRSKEIILRALKQGLGSAFFSRFARRAGSLFTRLLDYLASPRHFKGDP